MFIALTGLHSVGKSYLANSIMSKYGFHIYSKKDVVRFICKERAGREDWDDWYREEFNKDPYKMTKLILSYLDLKKDIILDAVHSDLEWGIIKNEIPNAEIIGIITPEYIRKTRHEEGDVEKDKLRIGYWHNGGGCLMTELSWTLNGGASLEINEKSFEEFLIYLKKKEIVFNENDICFSDSKVDKLYELIKENDKLNKTMQKANEFITKCNELKVGDER